MTVSSNTSLLPTNKIFENAWGLLQADFRVPAYLEACRRVQMAG